MTAKKQLRQQLLAKRQAIPAPQWQAQSYRLCQQLKVFPQVCAAHTICVYRGTRQEPDLSPLWNTLPDKHWGFPRCEGKALCWHAWSPRAKTPFDISHFRIEEPYPDWPPIEPSSVDVILVPVVACDRQGYRLGYGGGYYDRMFEQPIWQSVYKIGITFQDFLVRELPRDQWDIPLDAIATEQGILQIPVP